LEYGYNKVKTKREKPSVIAYEKYLEGIISKFTSDIAKAKRGDEGDVKLKYLKLYST
jgi:hypothetical protein